MPTELAILGDVPHPAHPAGASVKETAIDIQRVLPLLLPKAITWAESEANRVVASGQALTAVLAALARRVGVGRPELIRVEIADALPMPEDPDLQAAAIQTGLLGPHMAGLTLGHAVFIRRGHEATRLFAHEFRHVYQYEQAGSIAAFLPVYLMQIVQVGHSNAPFEVDACEHEHMDA